MAQNTVTFKQPLKLEFGGNIYKNALCLGDVDNDGLSELIVGNDKGDLAIFKGENPKPIRYASDLGLISCIAVGDLANLCRNVLLVINSGGACYIFDFHQKPPLLETDDRQEIKAAHFQKLPANIKMSLIGDINGDGFCEMVVALTDRIVRTYKWMSVGACGGVFPEGKLLGQNKWELSDQIGGIALNRSENSQTLLVSQPGGTCFTLKPPADAEASNFDENISKILNKMSIEYEALDSAACSDPKMMTEICGDIELEEAKGSFAQFKAASAGATAAISNSYYESEMQAAKSDTGYILATVDGMVMLVRDRKTLWKTALKRPIISVSQLLLPTKVRRSGPNVLGRCDKERSVSADSDFDDNTTEESSSESDRDDKSGVQSRSNFSTYPFLHSPSKGISGIMTTPTKIAISIPNSKPIRMSNSKKYGKPMDTKIVAFSSDGSAFVLDPADGKYNQFNFHDSVCCAVAGFYGQRKKDVPCLAFVADSNEIFVFCDVTNALEKRTNVMDVLREDQEYLDALKRMNIDINDQEQIRQLNSWLMYGYKMATVPFVIKQNTK